MNKIHVDFESRSRIDIQKTGAWAYSMHPSTEILCLAYAIDDGAVQLIRKEDLELLPPFDVADNLFIAHNAFFEQSMWTNLMVKKWGWPRIPIRQWRCTMAKALSNSYPQSLDGACKALNTPYQKSITGRTVMYKMCKPNAQGGWNEAPEDFEKLYQYCIEDVLAERSLDQTLPDLNPAEQTIWFLDQLVNARGISVDVEAVQKALQYIEDYTVRLNNIVYEQSGMALDRTTRRTAVFNWCKANGVEISGYTKGDVAKVLEEVLPENVRTVLETKLQLGKTSVAKYQALQNAVTKDNKIRDTLIFNGATPTGRWAGKLFQIHNLPKSSGIDTNIAVELMHQTPLEGFELFYPDVMGTLSACIRGMIVAAPGTELFVGDYSAIEARVVMWLADEMYGLKQFADGTDIYKDMARIVYDKKEVNKQERELGKAIILGCGFGMGKDKFHATCLAKGVLIEPELAEKSIELYRSTYSNVKNHWYALENAAIEAVHTRRNQISGKIQWIMREDNLYGYLPSGRPLVYPNASLEYVMTPWGEKKIALHYKAVDGISKRWVTESTYGGKLIENCTQAVARDILAEALLRLEREGYPIIFHVHDEIVSEVTKGDLKEYEHLMCTLPDWASGLPVKAECWRGTRYKKG